MIKLNLILLRVIFLVLKQTEESSDLRDEEYWAPPFLASTEIHSISIKLGLKMEFKVAHSK